jgi:hypothetical protein
MDDTDDDGGVGGAGTGGDAAETRPGESMISDPLSLLAVLQRLHASNDAVVFWNREETFKILVRNDPTDDDTCTFELAILCDEDEPDGARMHKCLQLEHDGFFDEPGVFSVETLSVRRDASASDSDLLHAVSVINDVYEYTVCKCGRYLIKDAQFLCEPHMCLHCQLTSRTGDKDVDFCPICQEKSFARHMETTPCCKQRLHKACADVWREKNSLCPLCRTGNV